MKLITQLKLDIGYTEKDIYKVLNKNYYLKQDEILFMEIVKESIDSRKKPNIFYSINLAIDVKSSALYKIKNCKDYVLDKKGLEYCDLKINTKRPVIVGFGPAGMFVGLVLAMSGLKPIIIEQGKKVEDRQRDIENFWTNGKLNKFSNVHYGEGGAGTFSDGKLNSNLDNPYCKKVINEFIANGAPKEIFYKSKPHIGSDNLAYIVKNIRNKILSYGGEILFNTKFVDLKSKSNSQYDILIKNVETNEELIIDTDILVFAVGHSALSTFELLKEKDFVLEKKPFAIGVRIEQKQSDINLMQYGKLDSRLPNADYKLVEHLPNGRSVFTFCMCPGGEVVCSSSEENTIVTNGMSMFKRDKEFANSALLVNILTSDFSDKNVLSGLYFQREYEKFAFIEGGSNYNAPCERVDSFLGYNLKNEKPLKTSYSLDIKMTSLKRVLPDFVYESLKEGIKIFKQKYKHFIKDENLLIGIETRTSCPIKIMRDENYQALEYKGVFPIGEGAGYAGGILSSAQDGIKAGEKIIEYIKTKNAKI